MFTHEDVIAWLDANPGEHTYGAVAEGLGSTSAAGQAVGACMRAIHNRGLHEYCQRVISSETGSHNCGDPS